MSYEIVPSTLVHVRTIARTMREDERAEIAAVGWKPRHLVHALYRSSDESWCALVDGKVAAVWGVRGPLMSETADVWLFTSPAIERIKHAFFKEARMRLSDLMATRRKLWSSVTPGHQKSIRFWTMLGFRLTDARPVGPCGAMFHDLVLERF